MLKVLDKSWISWCFIFFYLSQWTAAIPLAPYIEEVLVGCWFWGPCCHIYKSLIFSSRSKHKPANINLNRYGSGACVSGSASVCLQSSTLLWLFVTMKSGLCCTTALQNESSSQSTENSPEIEGRSKLANIANMRFIH